MRRPAFAVAFALLLVTLLTPPADAQNRRPPAKSKPVEPPSAQEVQTIRERRDALASSVAALKRRGLADPALADVEIFDKAADWVVRHNEWPAADTADQALTVLERGTKRATAANTASAPWREAFGTVQARAYRSRLDGSVQPYAVSIPAGYGKAPQQSWRLDVNLHGRDGTLTEVKFLHGFGAGKAVPAGQPFVQLDVYGRGNNAYRWAGEEDVFEAIDDFLRHEQARGRGALIDRRRVVLRGFSMGGAGTWHIGLHHPSRWAAIGPGAGFSVTRGYLGGLPAKLPDHVEKCLTIYDAAEYAENAASVPVVAYAGADDPQQAATRHVLKRTEPLGIPVTFLLAPDTEHKMPPEWAKKAEAEYAKSAGPGKGRPEYPDKVRFVTHTLKYPTCDWVTLLALTEHYRQARVEAERTGDGVKLTTKNVESLQITPPPRLSGPVQILIDGQSLKANAAGKPVILARSGDKWSVGGSAQPEGLRKSHRLQGPIDDAFTDRFLCVQGSGTPWHPEVDGHARAELERFVKEWDKWMRGRLTVKRDADVTADDIAGCHLILFGDPGSNSLIAKTAGRVAPLQWRRDRLALGGKDVDPATHLPALIYPNPLNPRRYVVLNSGHTIHAADFQGTNALLYPRLGDWALLRVAPKGEGVAAAQAVAAGLFNEQWRD